LLVGRHLVAVAVHGDQPQRHLATLRFARAEGGRDVQLATNVIDRAIEIAKEMGAKRAVPLPVSAPFHCPLMQPAAEAMRDALSYVVVETPIVPLYANVTAQPETDPDTIRNQLVEQVTGMVRWRESIANMTAAGVEEFVEIGGKVLGSMVKRISPDAKVTSLVTIEDIEALAEIA